MQETIEEVSTITAKGQTTVPKAVRKALGVDYGGRIAFRVGPSGVTVVRADESEDPALAAFLAFLAADIQGRPDQLSVLSPELAVRIAALTEGIDSDPEAAIQGDVAL
jgi:antitoxin PrlF